MTAIVGVVDADGNICMGGDTAGTSKGGDQSLFKNKKVFIPVHAPGFLLGVCGSFRLMQVLRFQFKPTLPPGPSDDFEEYASTVFSSDLMDCFRVAGMFEDFGEGVDGSFMVGYQGNLGMVQSNFQCVISRSPYSAIGAGDMIAYGSLFSTERQLPSERVATALRAAAYYNAMVREPFDILHLPFDNQWQASKKSTKKKRASTKK